MTGNGRYTAQPDHCHSVSPEYQFVMAHESDKRLVDEADYLDGVTIRDSIGGDQRLVFINDAALYSLHLSLGNRELPGLDSRYGRIQKNLNTICGSTYKIYTRIGIKSCVEYAAEMT